MALKIAINGFGRIGRTFLKLAIERGLKVVAINDVHGVDDAEYLLKYDSIYHRFKGKIEKKFNFLIVNGQKIEIINEMNPLALPWERLGVDVVIEASGKFTDRDSAMKHIVSGAKRVIITAPSEDPDVTIVPGVNNEKLHREHKVISVASCTTNCLTPMLKVINREFGIKRALMTTVHAYTNDQIIQDAFHKKPRRGRAGALNMIPTTTGAAEAVAAVLPELKGKVTGLAVRVPIPCGSLVDLVVELNKEYEVNEVNGALKKAAMKELKGIMEYSEDELVSSDVIGNSHSCVIDSLSTQVDGNLVKVLAWYDNEYGYTNRVIDVVKMLR